MESFKYSVKIESSYFVTGPKTNLNNVITQLVLQKGQDTSLLMVFLAFHLILHYKVFSLVKADQLLGL